MPGGNLLSVTSSALTSRLSTPATSASSLAPSSFAGSSRVNSYIDLSRWTEAEQAQVLAHYKLNELFPEKWEEDEQGEGGGVADGGEKGADNVSSILSGSHPSVNATMSPSSFSHSPENLIASHDESDLSDPLGIKATIWKQDRRQSLKWGAVLATRPQSQATQTLSSILISSKTFDPKAFLKQVHKTTSYQELEQGVANLAQSIENRQESTRYLVRTQFAKFVNAKRHVDAFYSQIREQNIIGGKNTGLGVFEKTLEDILPTSDSLYLPMLERRAKAEKIRITLAVLEQWRFFFNLPSNLNDLIKKGKYDAAARDYIKGKYIMNSSKGETKSRRSSRGLRNQKVFAEVWKEVTAIVSALQTTLFKQLTVESTSSETREKYLQYLIDLDAQDPLLIYLEAQYTLVNDKFIQARASYISQMQDVAVRMSPKRENTKASPAEKTVSAVSLRPELKLAQEKSLYQPDISIPSEFEKILNAVSFHSIGDIEDQLNVAVWQVTFKFIETICFILVKYFPDFHKLCKRVQKKGVSPGIRESNANSSFANTSSRETMLHSILDRFNKYVSDALFMEWKVYVKMMEQTSQIMKSTMLLEIPEQVDFVRAGESTSPETAEIPAFVKSCLESQSMVTCYFGVKVVNAVFACFESLKKLNMASKQQGNDTIAVFEALKRHLIHTICNSMVSASRNFYKYEKWELSVDPLLKTDKVHCTPLVELFSRFFKFHVRHLSGISAIVFHAQPTKAKVARGNAAAPFADASSPGNYRIEDPPDLWAEKTNEPMIATMTISKYLKHIRTSIFECMHIFLDGCEWLASQWRPPAKQDFFNNFTSSTATNINHSIHAKLYGNSIQMGFADQGGLKTSRKSSEVSRKVNVYDPDARLLLILLHVENILDVFLPQAVALFESKFNTVCPAQENEFRETAALLQSILFQNFLRRKTLRLTDVVEQGILFSGLDWNSLVKPQDVRPYCFEVLLTCTVVHAQVSEFSRALMRKILCQLTVSLGECLLKTYRQVDRFSPGGMLQAAMETEYIHHRLFSYETSESSAIFSMIYDTIEQFVDQAAFERVRDEMNDMLNMTKKNLARAKKTTLSLYLCFKDANSPDDLKSMDDLLEERESKAVP